jgi:hypothetical protein
VKTLVVCLAVLSSAVWLAADEKPVRTYTNDDLNRVSRYRDETGATSSPAVAPDTYHPARPAPGRHDEAYWRRETLKVQEQVRTLRHKAATLRLQIDEARRQAMEGSRSGGGRGRGAGGSSSRGRSSQGARTSPEALQARLDLVESEIRERQSALEDRARREGALPGWLR